MREKILRGIDVMIQEELYTAWKEEEKNAHIHG